MILPFRTPTTSSADLACPCGATFYIVGTVRQIEAAAQAFDEKHSLCRHPASANPVHEVLR